MAVQTRYFREIEPVRVYLPEPEVVDQQAARTWVRKQVIVTQTPTHKVVEEVRITETPEYQFRECVVHDPSAYWRALLDRGASLIAVGAGVLVVLLAFRLVLRLLGANPFADFARFIYNVSEVVLTPFQGLAATPAVGPGVLDLPALLAMFVYAIALCIVAQLMHALFAPAPHVVSRQHVSLHPRRR